MTNNNKSFIEQLHLPDDFSYKLLDSRDSKINELRIAIKGVHDVDTALDWINKLQLKSFVSWKISRTQVGGRLNDFKQCRYCQHRRNKQVRGQRTSKSTNCPATMQITVLREIKNSKGTRTRRSTLDGKWLGLVVFREQHNHEITDPGLLKYRNMSPETKESLLTLFRQGHSSSSALQCLKNDLQLQFGDQFSTVSVDGYFVPSLSRVHKLFTAFQKKELNSNVLAGNSEASINNKPVTILMDVAPENVSVPVACNPKQPVQEPVQDCHITTSLTYSGEPEIVYNNDINMPCSNNGTSIACSNDVNIGFTNPILCSNDAGIAEYASNLNAACSFAQIVNIDNGITMGHNFNVMPYTTKFIMTPHAGTLLSAPYETLCTVQPNILCNSVQNENVSKEIVQCHTFSTKDGNQVLGNNKLVELNSNNEIRDSRLNGMQVATESIPELSKEESLELTALLARITSGIETSPSVFVPAVRQMLNNTRKLARTDSGLATAMHMFARYTGAKPRTRSSLQHDSNL